jgi:hypothetical protein
MAETVDPPAAAAVQGSTDAAKTAPPPVDKQATAAATDEQPPPATTESIPAPTPAAATATITVPAPTTATATPAATPAAQDAAAAVPAPGPQVKVDDSRPADFEGEVTTNDDLPPPEALRKVENYIVLDRHGKTLTFKSLYKGKNVARRVLIIFVRHFFCGVGPALITPLDGLQAGELRSLASCAPSQPRMWRAIAFILRC